MTLKTSQVATVLAMARMFGVSFPQYSPPHRLSRDPVDVSDRLSAAEAKRQRKNAKRSARRAAEDSGNG